MSRLLATSRRLAFGVAAIALVASWTASGARADIAYAYAEETIGPLTANGTVSTGGGVVTVVGLKPLSQTSASLDAAGVAHSTATDNAPQSLIGPGPGEDSFVKYATFTPPGPTVTAGQLPSGPLPLTSFSRGDVLLSGLTGQAVAESYITGLGHQAAGHGGNVLQFEVTVDKTNTYVIHFDFSNDVYAAVNNSADSASGRFFFQIQIADAGGNVIFTQTPSGTAGFSTTGQAFAPPPAKEIVHSDHADVTTPSLTAGLHYFVTFTLDADTNVSTAVPEPATMAMVLTALPLLGLGLLRRRNRKAQA